MVRRTYSARYISDTSAQIDQANYQNHHRFNMSVPIPNTIPVSLQNQVIDNTGSYQLTTSDMAVLRVTPSASGNSNPTVQLLIDWGDGQTQSNGFTNVGVPQQFQHQYANQGIYSVTVTGQNTDGLSSTPGVGTILNIRVVVPQPNVVTATAHKWAGLSLPTATINQSLQTLTTGNAAPLYVSLFSAATQGSNQIQVSSNEEQFVGGAKVIISQPGKLITTLTVLDQVGITITLGGQLLDNYDQPGGGSATPAVVEVRAQSIATIMARTYSNKVTWYFPTTYDTSLIKASIRMLLSTIPGERAMLPTYGSYLYRIPFEQNNALTFSLIQNEVSRAITTWEPRVNVLRVQLTSNNNDINGVVYLQLADGSGMLDVPFSMSAP